MTEPSPLPFLSPEWIETVRNLREAHEAAAAVAAAADGRALPVVAVNLVVSGVPFGDGTVEVFLDTSSGAPAVEFGSLADAGVTVTTDYDTAKAVLVGGDPAAAMAAFLGGAALVQGDLMSLISLNLSLASDPRALDLAAAIRAVTA